MNAVVPSLISCAIFFLVGCSIDFDTIRPEINGRITDWSGKALQDVQVSFYAGEEGLLECKSNRSGKFTIPPYNRYNFSFLSGCPIYNGYIDRSFLIRFNKKNSGYGIVLNKSDDRIEQYVPVVLLRALSQYDSLNPLFFETMKFDQSIQPYQPVIILWDLIIYLEESPYIKATREYGK